MHNYITKGITWTINKMPQKFRLFVKIVNVSMKINQMKNREDVNWFFENNNYNPGKVLDLCGAYGLWGAHYNNLDKHSFKYTCLDINKKCIKFGRKYFKLLKLDDSEFVVHNVSEKLPFKKNEFDQIWLFGWFFEDIDRKHVFNEVKRVLRPNGSFLFTIPNEGHNSSILNTNKEELDSLLSQIGFSIEKIETFYSKTSEKPFSYFGIISKLQK